MAKKVNSKNKFKWFVKHRETINAVATIVLILVSIGLIIVTIYSARIASRLGKIEVYLAAEKEKQKTMEQITLAENLLLETFQNKAEAQRLLISLEKFKNSTEVTIDLLKDTRLKQAKDMIEFGSRKIRFQLDNYLAILFAIKDDLEEIRKATRNRDEKIRKERIDSAIIHANQLINGTVGNFRIDGFINDVEDYIKDRREYYDTIDKEMEDKLLKLPN